jgi:hypothetical protein
MLMALSRFSSPMRMMNPAWHARTFAAGSGLLNNRVQQAGPGRQRAPSQPVFPEKEQAMQTDQQTTRQVCKVGA